VSLHRDAEYNIVHSTLLACYLLIDGFWTGGLLLIEQLKPLKWLALDGVHEVITSYRMTAQFSSSFPLFDTT
jgi:hypothetical protein